MNPSDPTRFLISSFIVDPNTLLISQNRTTTTSAITSFAMMAFLKYPELPPELRLKIMDETLHSVSSTDRWVHGKEELHMSTFACIDREWNQVVERRLFKDIDLCHPRWVKTIQQELVEFGAICGKRSGLVSRIQLRSYNCDRAPSDNHPHLNILFQLFDLMKDWNHRDREQQGLIELRLNFQSVEDPLS